MFFLEMEKTDKPPQKEKPSKENEALTHSKQDDSAADQ